MKKTILAMLIACALCLSGCAMLDGLFMDQQRDEQGRVLYVDEQGHLTPEPTNPQTGKAREAAYSGEPSSFVSGASGVASALLGPWGAAAGAGIGLLASIYATLRGKRRVDGERAKSAAWQGGMTLLVGVVEDLKNGEIDADKDGKVSLAEIGAYVAKKGKQALNPQFVAEVVRVVTSTMSDADKQKALEAAAAKVG